MNDTYLYWQVSVHHIQEMFEGNSTDDLKKRVYENQSHKKLICSVYSFVKQRSLWTSSDAQ